MKVIKRILTAYANAISIVCAYIMLGLSLIVSFLIIFLSKVLTLGFSSLHLKDIIFKTDKIDKETDSET